MDSSAYGYSLSLFQKPWGEGVSGHISVRDPVLPDNFWFNPFAMHYSLIRASDLVLVDSYGYVVEGGNQAMINEAGFMIHSEVHHARPEVQAVAHTQSVYGKTWSSFGKNIEMLTQGRFKSHILHAFRSLSILTFYSPKHRFMQLLCLITCGATVDEAALLFYSLEKACHSQLLAEPAAANGIAKKIIPADVAQFTADSNNFYLEFQPEFDLIVRQSGGEVLQLE
ncbi:class II aldolase/adducin N-terminal [Penicillium malachiteum]|nr:class II aldolase/adducin N-terminal [Penicillium malachiteum]